MAHLNTSNTNYKIMAYQSFDIECATAEAKRSPPPCTHTMTTYRDKASTVFVVLPVSNTKPILFHAHHRDLQ